jgi:hypothetical protein
MIERNPRPQSVKITDTHTPCRAGQACHDTRMLAGCTVISTHENRNLQRPLRATGTFFATNQLDSPHHAQQNPYLTIAQARATGCLKAQFPVK